MTLFLDVSALTVDCSISISWPAVDVMSGPNRDGMRRYYKHVVLYSFRPAILCVRDYRRRYADIAETTLQVRSPTLIIVHTHTLIRAYTGCWQINCVCACVRARIYVSATSVCACGLRMSGQYLSTRHGRTYDLHHCRHRRRRRQTSASRVYSLLCTLRVAF